MRADSGFYSHAIVAACRDKSVRFSITVRQHQSVRNIIEAIPETDWTPIPYWMEGAADVAETEYTPFGSEPDAVPVRLIVRRVKPTPGSQLALFTSYSYHAFITDRNGDTLDLEADHRRHAEIENAIRDLKYGVGAQSSPLGTLSRQRCLAGRTGDGPQPGTLDRTYRSRRGSGYHQDPSATLLLPGRTHHPQDAASHPAPPPGLALEKPVQLRPGAIARPATPFLTAYDPSAALPNPPGGFAPSRSLSVSCCKLTANLPHHQHRAVRNHLPVAGSPLTRQGHSVVIARSAATWQSR